MYIIIEKHGGWEYATIVTNEDGTNKVFDTVEDTKEEVDNCQDGIVVGDDVVIESRVYLEEEVLALLVSMDMAINPENYKSSSTLGVEDFTDLAICKAQELGVEEKFNSFRLKESL